MRHGFTVPETIIALTVVGLLLGIAIPPVAALRDSLAVAEASQHLMAAHRRGRITSILQGRPAVLTINAYAFTLRLSGAGADLWAAAGPSAFGVALEGPVRNLTFSPVGITTGLSNATFRLSRGSANRTIVISRLGRVRRAVP
jgi:prepilin-type N-terminal cleavage/methylation domain-containing protein